MNKFLLFAAFLIFPIAAFAQERSDFQIWNDTQLSIPLVTERVVKTPNTDGKEVERLSFFISGILRSGDDSSRIYDKRVSAGFVYRLNRFLSFSPGYVYRETVPRPGRKTIEQRIQMAATVEKSWSRFSLADRNQLEYRLRTPQADDLRFKNRLRLNVPLRRDKKEIVTPFVSNEVFYNFQLEKLQRDELFIGAGKKFTDYFSGELFYLFVADRSNPKFVNGFGVNLRFKAKIFK